MKILGGWLGAWLAGAVALCCGAGLLLCAGVSGVVSWQPAAGAQGYRIYFRSNAAGPWVLVGETTGTNWAFCDFPFEFGQFKVTATNAAGESR